MRGYTMGWISVDTRLPKKLEKVLFHWLLNGHGKNISMGYMCDTGWNIYLPYMSHGLNADVCHVTHWRHLPDFPKFKPPVRQVGAIIIDDPLAQLHEDVYKEFMVHGECMVYYPNDGSLPIIEKSFRKPPENATEFAKKFCEENKYLLKRLADK